MENGKDLKIKIWGDGTGSWCQKKWKAEKDWNCEQYKIGKNRGFNVDTYIVCV